MNSVFTDDVYDVWEQNIYKNLIFFVQKVQILRLNSVFVFKLSFFTIFYFIFGPKVSLVLFWLLK